jgi:chromosome partitioning protein
MSARVLAIANQKGGVGKTTTALTLAAALGRLGKKVMVMDLDPHACASIHLRQYPESLERTAYDLFQTDEDAQAALWPTVICSGDGLPFDFTPGSIRLSELEIDLHEKPGKGLILKRALARLETEYDYILLDCPPQLGVLLVNALVASDLLIIPIQTDFLALHGLRLLFDSIRTLNRVLPKPIEYRTLATMFDRRAGACRRVLNLLRRKMGENMFESIIDMDTKFREASGGGLVIYDVAPNSRGALEYTQLAKEILKI